MFFKYVKTELNVKEKIEYRRSNELKIEELLYEKPKYSK